MYNKRFTFSGNEIKRFAAAAIADDDDDDDDKIIRLFALHCICVGVGG